jgi:hypothetical protein
VHHRRKPARQCRDADHARAERYRRCRVSRVQQVLRFLPEAVLLMAALVLDDLRALDNREQRSASGRVTKFSGEPLEDDVSTLHPVSGTA